MSSRVILIDTDPRGLESTAFLLEEQGLDPVCARTFQQIDRALAGHEDQVVVIEPVLEGIDGFELCRAVRKVYNASPPTVLLASSKIRGEAHRRRAEDVGAHAFLERPAHDDELVQALRTVLTQREAAAAAPAVGVLPRRRPAWVPLAASVVGIAAGLGLGYHFFHTTPPVPAAQRSFLASGGFSLETAPDLPGLGVPVIGYVAELDVATSEPGAPRPSPPPRPTKRQAVTPPPPEKAVAAARQPSPAAPAAVVANETIEDLEAAHVPGLDLALPEMPVEGGAVAEGTTDEAPLWTLEIGAQPGAAPSSVEAQVARVPDVEPRLIASSRVAPVYPYSARRLRAEGQVVLRARVLTDGTLSEVEVVKEPGRHLGLGRAALDAVRQWRYEPATSAGTPVEWPITIQVDFKRR
ncbi:MAG: TonB family protein [bacterium]|nr:TonB family protein [bacterium]